MKDLTIGGLIALQARVIGALVLRETRATFGTTQFGYLWAIVTPCAGVAVLAAIFSAVGRQSPFGASLALFFATGILTLEFFNKLSNSLMMTFDANNALLTYPLIKETDTLFARLILISATYFVIMLILFSGLVQFNLADWPAHPEELVQAFVAIALLGFGFGTLNAVLISLLDSWRHIEKILTRPLFFISGIFYVPSGLPTEVISILKWNPVLHLVEWMRTGYYPNYNSIVLDKTYPLGIAMILILFGLAGERIYRKKRV
jgi:capsular polysaccharide transport system permease protein